MTTRTYDDKEITSEYPRISLDTPTEAYNLAVSNFYNIYDQHGNIVANINFLHDPEDCSSTFIEVSDVTNNTVTPYIPATGSRILIGNTHFTCSRPRTSSGKRDYNHLQITIDASYDVRAS